MPFLFLCLTGLILFAVWHGWGYLLEYGQLIGSYTTEGCNACSPGPIHCSWPHQCNVLISSWLQDDELNKCTGSLSQVLISVFHTLETSSFSYFKTNSALSLIMAISTSLMLTFPTCIVSPSDQHASHWLFPGSRNYHCTLCFHSSPSRWFS